MIPVPGLEQVKISWINIQKEGFNLFGFLLYTACDKVVTEYIKDGIFDLDILSGEDCAIFVVEPPSKNWIDYTKNKNHIWWKLYGNKLEKKDSLFTQSKIDDFVENFTSIFRKNIIANNKNCNIIIGDGNTITLDQLINPSLSELYNRSESINVARHFNLTAKDIPCLIFFKDINDTVIWNSPLGNLTSHERLNYFFRDFFESNEFKSLLIR